MPVPVEDLLEGIGYDRVLLKVEEMRKASAVAGTETRDGAASDRLHIPG